MRYCGVQKRQSSTALSSPLEREPSDGGGRWTIMRKEIDTKHHCMSDANKVWKVSAIVMLYVRFVGLRERDRRLQVKAIGA